MAFYNANQEFSDGTIIKPLNRDEYIYQKADGRVAHPYMGVAGTGSGYDRVLTLSSLDTWVTPAGAQISVGDRQEILRKLRQYKKVRRLKLGVLEANMSAPLAFDDAYINALVGQTEL